MHCTLRRKKWTISEGAQASQHMPKLQMSAAAAAFVEAHHGALERMLAEASAPGSRAWQPGEADLEAAALVLQLLQWLVPHHKEHRTGAVQDLWSKAFLCVLIPCLRSAEG